VWHPMGILGKARCLRNRPQPRGWARFAFSLGCSIAITVVPIVPIQRLSPLLRYSCLTQKLAHILVAINIALP